LVALGAVGYYILPQFDVFYVRARIDVWLDPWLDIQTDPKWASIIADLTQRRGETPETERHINIDGDQIIQTWRALHYGGLTGQGLGQGASYIIPAAQNDMAFAVVIEQLGWIGGLLILAAYLILILRGFRIAFHNRRREGVLLAAGLTSLLGFQTFIIIAGTFGAIPLTGITVPFISMGGTSIIISFIYIGFLLRLSTAQTQPDPAPLPFEVHHLYNSIPHLAALFLIIFPLAAGVGIVRIRNNADRLSTAQAPFNPWIQVEINRTLRGAILDRNGNPIVYSDTRGGRRIYPDPLLAESLGQTVGYNSAIYGPSGLEYTFNDYLNGRGHNNILMEWFSRVRYILTREFNGQDLQTTIDPDLQKMVYNLMRDPARVHNAGAALLMDPQTGEILALVSVPTFDPALIDSLYPTLTDADQLLVNRVTQGFYAPGSVFKIFTAAAALDRPTYGPDGSLITQETMFYYANDLQAPPDPYGAGYTTWWHEGACAITQSPQGFGNFTFAQALAYSDNVAFAEVGQAMGPFRLRDYAERFGIGQSFEIGVDVLPSNLAYEPEYLNTPCGLAQTAFGQGQLYVTPLQIGLIGATIANEGELPYPQLVSQPRIAKRGWRVIEQETAQQVTEMMIAVTEDEYGSGYNARIESVQVAGKTGTAQTNGPPHAWFIGFAPADDPQYLAVVVLENQGEGSQWAAPLVRDILYNALRVGRE
ncbi:MAG TPA: hypothetical protein ENN19_03350, partial [Chloroflexi bacterium]|nr:hypothetical protein [Chloroflexota bacterium]